MKVLSVSLISGPSPEGRRAIMESLVATFTLKTSVERTRRGGWRGVWLGATKQHPPVHPLEAKPCLAPSAIDNDRRMALRLSALRSALRRYVGDVFHAKAGHARDFGGGFLVLLVLRWQRSGLIVGEVKLRLGLFLAAAVCRRCCIGRRIRPCRIFRRFSRA